MSAPRDVSDDVLDRQHKASDPAVSAWVSANAGAGKTHVLAQRVIRLLLTGVDPERILCITFTKAAAANMANRVFDELRQWTALGDAALGRAMRAIGVRVHDGAQRSRARQLFALALETPGGLKVQTIHAFCTHILHLFPFEANVAARFAVLDETAETQLLDRLTLAVLLDAAAAPDSAPGRALANAITAAADVTFRDLVREALGEHDRLTAWFEAAGGVEAAIAQLARVLGIDAKDSNEKVDAEFFKASLLPAAEWPAVAAALAQGSKSDGEQGRRFASLAGLADTERRDAYLDIFCTQEGLPRKTIVTKATQTQHPALFQRLLGEQERVCALLAHRHAIAARKRSAALFTIADAVLTRYRAEKNRRGLLDYDDLIGKTDTLLANISSAWVHYKLDRGIEHVLIDEAQDTSPKQWRIIRHLVAEFFAGAGASSARRTIFAVGDEKQSIFSFQGAAPREFDAMRRAFDALSKAAERELRQVRFHHSFRSGENVLAAVDHVFESREIYVSVTSDEAGIPHHIALPDAAPGLVELWDTEKPADKREIEGWDGPFDEVSEASPVARLARKIAKTVKQWQRQGARPGDVLVLVRRRGALFETIVRALKNENIAVAGADRLVLTEHIAVMDLLALADALLLPQDDLALASVLKSPLFGLTEDGLFDLAWQRAGSLRAALQAKRPELAGRIDAMAAAARRLSPFGFYAEMLGAGGGRRQILARLGAEANDALDEFLNLALDYERNETPSLQGFAAWLRATKSEVKRDMEMVRDEVRVMTVHGAKGLEAPIVILADTTTPPHGWHPPRLLALPVPGAPPGTPDCLVWVGRKSADAGGMGAAREAERGAVQDEYRRLLYVAMTRAAERLIVCGVGGDKAMPAGCWYELVQQGLAATGKLAQEDADFGGGKVWRYRKTAANKPLKMAAATAPPAVVELPDWLRHDVRVEAPTVRRLAPSATATDEAAPLARASPDITRKARARGILVHRLLQSLPDIAVEHRAAAAQRYLARAGGELAAEDRRSVAEQVLALLEDARFYELFGPASRAEVPIVGRLETPGKPPFLVSGQVDRLAITDKEILIADYKTGSPPRKGAPDPYVRQLALYRAVLAKLYPARVVRAALIWTDVPDLMELSPAALDRALAYVTSA